MISESTYKELRGSFAARYLGEVTVKGKVIPAKIYSVEGRAEDGLDWIT